MKTVVLNFTQPSSKEVLVLLAPDDMDVQAEIAECRTRSHRSSFSRECRSATVYNWLCDRGCKEPDEEIVMIDGWHEPPMTRPRSENCNVPLVEPYIRIGDVPDESDRDDWVAAASRQIGVSAIPDADADFVAPSDSQIGGNYRPIADLTQEECAARALRRPVRTETVPNNIYQTMLPGRPIEWRPFARNMEIAVEPGDANYQWTASSVSVESISEAVREAESRLARFTNPASRTWGDGRVDLDEMRELARRAAGISEARAAALSPPPTTRDQDQQ